MRIAHVTACRACRRCVESRSACGAGVFLSSASVRIRDNRAIRILAHSVHFRVGGGGRRAARLSPDGATLAWLRWNHPSMPWDATELVIRDLDSGTESVIAGGPDESVLEPRLVEPVPLHTGLRSRDRRQRRGRDRAKKPRVRRARPPRSRRHDHRSGHAVLTDHVAARRPRRHAELSFYAQVAGLRPSQQ
jgi:hypothetical protein